MKRTTWTTIVLLVAACGDDTTADSTSAADTSTTDTSSATDVGPASSGPDGGTTEVTTGSPATSTGPVDTGGSDATAGESTGAAAPTWDNFAMAFFETYCWECHGPGDTLRDYSVLAEVMAESATIRCGTAPSDAMLTGCEGQPPAGQFPIGANLPSDDERAALVEWIDAGLP